MEATNTMTLPAFIEATKDGKLFTVEFIKRTTGEIRVMNARRGVRKGVKGVGLRYNPAEYSLLNVYDMQDGGFRSINLENLVALRMGGKKYTWNAENKLFTEVATA